MKHFYLKKLLLAQKRYINFITWNKGTLKIIFIVKSKIKSTSKLLKL